MPSSLMTVLSTSKQTASALRKTSFVSDSVAIMLRERKAQSMTGMQLQQHFKGRYQAILGSHMRVNLIVISRDWFAPAAAWLHCITKPLYAVDVLYPVKQQTHPLTEIPMCKHFCINGVQINVPGPVVCDKNALHKKGLCLNKPYYERPTDILCTYCVTPRHTTDDPSWRHQNKGEDGKTRSKLAANTPPCRSS